MVKRVNTLPSEALNQPQQIQKQLAEKARLRKVVKDLMNEVQHGTEMETLGPEGREGNNTGWANERERMHRLNDSLRSIPDQATDKMQAVIHRFRQDQDVVRAGDRDYVEYTRSHLQHQIQEMKAEIAKLKRPWWEKLAERYINR